MLAVKVLICLTVVVFSAQKTCAFRSAYHPWTSWPDWETWSPWWPCRGWACLYSRSSRISCEGIQQAMVTRDEWNAVEPRLVQPFKVIPNKVIVHHTGPDTCSVIGLSGSNCDDCLHDCVKELIRALQDRDFSDGLNDIKYNFLIDQDGVVYEGRGWDAVGQHTKGQDESSIGILMIGDFTSSEPNDASQKALRDLIACGESTGKLRRPAQVIIFRDFPDK